MLPQSYDRTKEKAQGIIEVVAKATAEGRLPISVPIASDLPLKKATAKAEYIAKRIYSAWRRVRNEAQEADMPCPKFPIISRHSNVLVFKEPEQLEYTVIEGDITKHSSEGRGMI